MCAGRAGPGPRAGAIRSPYTNRLGAGAVASESKKRIARARRGQDGELMHTYSPRQKARYWLCPLGLSDWGARGRAWPRRRAGQGRLPCPQGREHMRPDARSSSVSLSSSRTSAVFDFFLNRFRILAPTSPEGAMVEVGRGGGEGRGEGGGSLNRRDIEQASVVYLSVSLSCLARPLSLHKPKAERRVRQCRPSQSSPRPPSHPSSTPTGSWPPARLRPPGATPCRSGSSEWRDGERERGHRRALLNLHPLHPSPHHFN